MIQRLIAFANISGYLYCCKNTITAYLDINIQSSKNGKFDSIGLLASSSLAIVLKTYANSPN